MFNHFSVYSRSSVRLLLGVYLGIFLVVLTLAFLPQPHRDEQSPTDGVAKTLPDEMPKLHGAEAAEYLEAKGESKSLMKAVTNARFGLKWQKHSPFGDKGPGYLALSHDQDLNAWFDETGVTIRSTNSDAQSGSRVRMQLKALGYGARLTAAPPIVDRSAAGNRIEYRRENSEVIEWYENRSGGIEQGFTINRRPERENSVAGEPLRIVVSIAGDLHARLTDEGQKIQLVNAAGESKMSYGKLVTKDAESQTIAGHLETTAAGDEVVLVIEDQNAVYPLVIDPITATEESRLFASSIGAGNAFGGAVAISGNLAVVGAWGEDVLGNPDTGSVYVFVRSGSTWLLDQPISPLSAPLRCGWTVAVEGFFVVFGCPATPTTSGRVFVAKRLAAQNYQLLSLNPSGDVVGDSFGWSVSINGDKVAVGVPNFDTPAQINAGAAFVYQLDTNFTVSRNWELTAPQPQANAQFGYDVDVSGSAVVIGQPLADTPIMDSGSAFVFRVDQFGAFRDEGQILPDDPGATDHFGADVAISGDTVAVGSPLDDNLRGADAGSVYVFTRGTNGVWTKQQKLIASDGFANDQFSAFALDIQDNTLVVGAYRNDYPHLFFSPNEDSGEAYVFTRSDSTWSEQARFRASDGSPSDLFGIAIAISGDTVIVGAQNDDVSGQSDAGSAYVYRLSCLGGPQRHVGYLSNNIPLTENAAGLEICENQVILLVDPTVNAVEPDYQWRRNGVNIPGARIATYQPSQPGVYDFIVTTGCISQTSTPFTLTISTGCGINPTSAHFPTAGGNGVVDIMAPSGCRWEVSGIFSLPENPSVTFATTSGQGSGTLNYTVHQNAGTARVIFVSIAGKGLVISQDGFPNIRVMNANDSGPGSLRSAITMANRSTEDDLITFDIPGPGPHTIDLATALPRLNDTVSIVNDRPGDPPVVVRRQPGSPNFRIFDINLNQTVLIAGLTIQDGRGSPGGGIVNGGSLTVRNSTIRDNMSSGVGGAILNDIGARLDLINCSVFGNSTTSSDGGAVFGLDNSTLNIVNSSFNGNSTGGRGAIFIRFARLQVVNSTFNVNSSASGGGSIHNISGAVSVGNTIFRRSMGENIVSDNSNGGSFTSLGHNLCDDAAGGDAGVGPGGLLNGGSDIRNTNPGLLNMGNNGGPTLTNALLNTSPAINAGDDSLLAPSSIFADQRGFARKVGTHVDIGAFECNSVAAPSFVQLSAPAYSASEGSNRATITVNRSGNISGNAKVDYAATVGSYIPCGLLTGMAAQNCDYIIASGTLTFGPSETSKTFDVLIVDDAYVEGNEVLNVTLTNPTGAAVGSVIASTLTISDNDSTAPNANPVDAAQFFVREHYYDFLSRSPDQGGLDYWSSQITGCGSNPACVNSRRVGVSAAYFIELEFQQTGYVVYRIYRAALGTAPSAPNRANLSYQQFMPDRSQLVAGPQLAQTTLEFANRFVQRAEFLSKYRNAGTNTQFVNTLFDTAGLTPFTAERQLAINAMNGGRTRAQVLLDVIELSEFKTREYNPAFVLMQYYGYLRRDPDQGGYDFWLDVLNNRVPGNFLGMVCAFITAPEYQQRFSPVVTRSNSACAP